MPSSCPGSASWGPSSASPWSPRTGPRRCASSSSPGALTVVSENPDLGEASEALEVPYEGPEVTVGFNARYLIDVLGVLSTDAIRLTVSDELSPAVVQPEGEDGYTAVVMPMRI